MTSFHCELAWLGGDDAAADVFIETADDRITAVSPGTAAQSGAIRLAGLTLPGVANTHSHVFHRALRGRTQVGVADFWAWREQMYELAARLDPDSLYRLALGTYAEMALAGFTSVGEFHYLHHGADGRPYDDANAMGRAVIRAAHDAGLRITLLDTCYLQADFGGTALAGPQRRFGDGSVERWAERVNELSDGPMVRIGSAIHSVRAMPREALGPVVQYAVGRSMPLHVHLSEQPAENEACLAAHGRTPTQLLDDAGAWSMSSTAVHATHLSDEDIETLGSARTSISMCPTTERDLGDGVGPAVRLAEAGSPLCIGTDSHAFIDPWEEARAIELDERLISGTRGNLGAPALLKAMTSSGAASLGWDAGRIVPGALADFVTVALDTPRTAGARSGDPLAHVVFAAAAADVTDVVVGGRHIVEHGRHVDIEHPGALLESEIAQLVG